MRKEYENNLIKLIEKKFDIEMDKFRINEFVLDLLENKDKEIERLNNIINKAIDFVESMGYAGYEDYFYDLTTEDKNGNDNCFVDSQRKLLSILKGEDIE